MKEVGLVIRLHQPSNLEESAFRQIMSERYIPLIKLIKESREFSFSLIVPLNIFDLMDRCGYNEALQDIKNLHDQERVELVSTTPYNSYITPFSNEFIEKQIILNEYGLGYYNGSTQGFEGEPASIIKNLNTFYSPDFDLNNEKIRLLSEYGYSNILVGKHLPEILYGFEASETCLVGVEDLDLQFYSEDISTTNNFTNNFLNSGSVVYWDIDNIESGDPVYACENFIESVRKEGGLIVSVQNYVKNKAVSEGKATLVSVKIEKIYDKLQEIESVLAHSIERMDTLVQDDYEIIPFWKDTHISKINEYNQYKSLILVSKFLDSHKYTENSKISDFLNFSMDAIKYIDDEDITKKVEEIVEKIDF